MYRKVPSLRSLRAFEAVARFGSMSSAAIELNVTQGAVSHQIRGLETELGVELFVRDGNRLILSAAGASLLPSIKASLEKIADSVSRIDRSTAEGELAIHSVPAFMSYWLLPRIEQFTARYPRIHLRCGVIGYESSPLDPDSDVMIRCGTGDWPNVSLRLIARFEHFPVCSPALLNSNPIRSNADLRNHVLLHADGGVDWSNWLAAAGVLRSNILGEHFMSDARLAIEAAMYGNGVALGDTITVQRALEAGTLVAPLPLRVPAMSSFYLALKPEMEQSPLVETFCNWLVSELSAESARLS